MKLTTEQIREAVCTTVSIDGEIHVDPEREKAFTEWLERFGSNYAINVLLGGVRAIKEAQERHGIES